ncbi:glycosyltransferase family 1 protein [Peribacillus frigoritolerans]|uniref:glycosyltransferase family 1 protein n=1 Tax=Peribacillus frigoritolerans TaxID=450367 RepID=UPI003446D40B
MSKPIRVLHVVRKMDFGGVQSMLMNYYRNINRELVQFDFLVQGNEPGFFDNEITSLGGKIYQVTPMKENLLKYHRDVKSILRKTNYKIVQAHQNFANIHSLTQAHWSKIEVIISHSHNAFPERSVFKQIIKKFIQYRINKISTYKFACSKKAGEWLYGREQLENGKVKIINNGIVSEEFKYNQEISNKIRKDLNITGKFVIGHIGNFSSQKNHNFLIDIFNDVYKEKKEAKLVLVGIGELEQIVKEKVIKLGLEKQVLFLGKRSDVSSLMQAFDILVFPSLYEGLPVVLVEAQASGMKCIISKDITDEVKITDLIESISLNEPSNYWAKNVVNYSYGFERNDTSKLIEDNGYDIKVEAKRLENLYLEMI